MIIDTQILFLAILGGTIPAVLWLWFWLREDSAHPEPKSLLLCAFISGMMAVPLVLPFEKAIYETFLGSDLLMIMLLAFVEEVFKFGAAFAIAFRTKAFDEPIDAIIYMLTVALGFSAAENTLFLFNTLTDGLIIESVVTGNLRFIGASLLHLVSSSTVGIFIAFAFYKGNMYRAIFSMIGLFFAIVLHTSFNLFIIESRGIQIFYTFGAVWLGVVILLLIFEKVKKIYPFISKFK